MAAPTFQSSSAIFATAAATTIGVTLPTHQAGDILIVAAGYSDGSDLTIDGSWSVLMAAENYAELSTAIWWFRATSASTTNPTVTSSVTASGAAGLFAQAHVIRGCVASGTPFEDATATNPATSTLTALPTSEIDTTGVDRLAVCFLLVDDNIGYAVPPPPASWATQSDVDTTVSVDFRFLTISREIATASTVPAVTAATLTNPRRVKTLTTGFIPAAGGAAAVTRRRRGLMGVGR